MKLAIVGEWLEFFLKNLVTPVAFFITFKQYGAKPAITLAVVVTLVQIVIHWLLSIRISPFFIVASFFTILFGGMDLLITEPRYFRLEPFVQNLVLATVFGITLYTHKPIAAWFAEALPASVRPELEHVEGKYLRTVTVVWTFYFLAKAFLYLYLALTVDLGELVILRTLIGGGSIAVLFLGEIVYRKRLRGHPTLR